MPELHNHLDRFIAHQTALGRTHDTLRGRQRYLREAINVLHGRGVLRAADIQPDDLDAVLAQWRDRGLSASSIHQGVGSVRLFCQWLALRGLVMRDPSLDLDSAAVAEPLPPAPLSEAQVAGLLDGIVVRTVGDLRNRAVAELLYGCGLRLAEALDAKLDQFDANQRTFLAKGKGGHERLVPVLPSTLAVMQDYLSLRRTLLRGPDPGWLFLSIHGKAAEHGTFQAWLRGLGRRVLGPEVRVYPHALRHAIAVHLLRRGTDIRHIQEFLGHADLDTTKIYLRLVPGHLKDDYDAAMPSLAGPPPSGAPPTLQAPASAQAGTP